MYCPSDDLDGPLTRAAKYLLSGSALSSASAAQDFISTQFAEKRLRLRLLDYLSDTDARIRGDASHYLSLTRDSSYIPHIENLLLDESEEVREIAQDSLDDLRDSD